MKGKPCVRVRSTEEPVKLLEGTRPTMFRAAKTAPARKVHWAPNAVRSTPAITLAASRAAPGAGSNMP